MLARTQLPRSLASSSKQPFKQTSFHTLQHHTREAECSKAVSRKHVPVSYVTFIQTRWNSTSRPDNKPTTNHQSIFNTPDSPWEQLFAGPNFNSSKNTSPKPFSQQRSQSGSGNRRVEMTAQEQKTFTDLFDEIFRVADATGAKLDDKGREDGDTSPAFSTDFYERIRRTPRQPKWNYDSDEELDKKKEDMEMCHTDQELLEWTIYDVFAQSQKYEEEARAIGTQTKSKRTTTLQPPWYPFIIAHLMRTFRDKYNNPQTALAIFNYAKNLSVASYAFGCSTDAYNELIETHWSCFRDVNAVIHAFKDMGVNGVMMNSKTGRLMDTVRRDVGAEKLWSEEEVSNIITRLDAVRRDAEGLQKTSKKFKGRRKWDQWKQQSLQDDPDDKWGFNSWDTPSTTKASWA